MSFILGGFLDDRGGEAIILDGFYTATAEQGWLDGSLLFLPGIHGDLRTMPALDGAAAIIPALAGEVINP